VITTSKVVSILSLVSKILRGRKETTIMSELRRFFFEEEGEIVEWAVFMLILLAFTVFIILTVGGQARDMWTGITERIAVVLGRVPPMQ